MIYLPRRSVTRFFIPLIDVLLLLFCIFLLMPLVSEESADAERKKGAYEDQTEELQRLRAQVKRQKEELARLRHLRDPAAEIERLREQLKQLTQKQMQNLQQNARILDIDGKTGKIGFFDHEARKRIPMDSEKAAHELIQRLRRSADNKELLFLFVYPREDSGYPTLEQEDEYKRWFAKTNHAFVGRE